MIHQMRSGANITGIKLSLLALVMIVAGVFFYHDVDAAVLVSQYATDTSSFSPFGCVFSSGGVGGIHTSCGQTFTPVNNIDVDSINVYIDHSGQGTNLQAYLRENFSGPATWDNGTIISSGGVTVNSTFGTYSQVWVFNFGSPVNLVAGQTYALEIVNSDGIRRVADTDARLRRSAIDVYAGGESFNLRNDGNNSGFSFVHAQGGDFWFEISGPQPAVSLSSLAQFKSDLATTIDEGGITAEDTLAFRAFLDSSSSNPLQLEVEYTAGAFTGIPNATSVSVSPGSFVVATAADLQNGNYKWQARARDTVTSAVSSWVEFGTPGNVDFIVNDLGQAAASLAKLVINSPYLGDGNTFGGKGWDPLQELYVSPNEIDSGYHFWNNKLRTVAFGAGLDCSGLVEWAFNRSFDPSKSLTHNAVRWDGANGQYLHNSDPLVGNLKPGNLLFLDKDNNGKKDHVAVYVGDNITFDIVEAFSPQQGIRSTTKAEFEARIGFVASQDLRRVVLSPTLGGFAQAGSPIDLQVTDPDGFTITATTSVQTDEELLREVPGQLYYSESQLGSDGRPESIVYWPVQKTGDYLVRAISQAGVSSTSTYSLTFQAGSTTILLAQDVPVSQIPNEGYGIATSATGTTNFFIPVSIDIKPGSHPNTINLGSNGVAAVAIFGSATFDVHQVNPASTTLANAVIKLKGNGQPQINYSDVNDDGFTDVTINVLIEALQLTSSDVKADLIGRLTNGDLIKGSDSVRIVP
jgi:cell wall-associated NlpC family hydrolase